MKRALVLAVLLACDDREALRRPDPTLARMLEQRRGDPYAEGVMRAPPPDTVPRDDDTDDPPPPITRALVDLGRARFDLVCATCHGVAGDGKSAVAAKMELRPPPSLHEPRLRALPLDAIARIAGAGYGLMPGFAGTLDARARWAVAAYVRALQLSRHARAAAFPPDVRAVLDREAR